jgi:hypothetical protein
MNPFQTDIAPSFHPCSECGGILTAMIEHNLDLCLPCLQKVPAQLKDVKRQRDEIAAQGLEAYNKLIEVQKLYSRRLSLDEAEQSGRSAAERGFADDQNPYTDEEMKFMWNHGWLQGSLGDQFARDRSVVVWALTQLPTIQEIALGTGQTEIAQKLELVIDKLTPMVADILQE